MITRHDHFAAAALQGLLAGGAAADDLPALAAFAHDIAAAMVAHDPAKQRTAPLDPPPVSNVRPLFDAPPIKMVPVPVLGRIS